MTYLKLRGNGPRKLSIISSYRFFFPYWVIIILSLLSIVHCLLAWHLCLELLQICYSEIYFFSLLTASLMHKNGRETFIIGIGVRKLRPHTSAVHLKLSIFVRPLPTSRFLHFAFHPCAVIGYFLVNCNKLVSKDVSKDLRRC